MLNVYGIQLSLLELVLLGVVLALMSVTFLCLRRLSLLELKLNKVEAAATREIKMVNQGAIGIGRRFAKIEKNFKSANNVANFVAKPAPSVVKKPYEEVVHSLKAVKTTTNVSRKPANSQSTRAEQALSAWIDENQSA